MVVKTIFCGGGGGGHEGILKYLAPSSMFYVSKFGLGISKMYDKHTNYKNVNKVESSIFELKSLEGNFTHIAPSAFDTI